MYTLRTNTWTEGQGRWNDDLEDFVPVDIKLPPAWTTLMVCPAAEVKEVEAIVTAATDGVVDVTGEAIFEVAAAAAAKAAIPVMLPCWPTKNQIQILWIDT